MLMISRHLTQYLVWFGALLFFLLLPPTIHSASAASLKFDGIDDYVKIADTTNLRPKTAIALEAWIKPESSTGLRYVIGKYKYRLYIQPLNAGFQVHYEANVNDAFRKLSSGELPWNQWVHVAGIYDGKVMRLYINGLQVKTLDIVGTLDVSSNNLFIGAAHDTGYKFKGTIDEVRISKASRYQYAYTPPRAEYLNDEFTVGLWHFDENTGTVANDSSAYHHTGTLTKGPMWVADSPLRPTNPRHTYGQWSRPMKWPIVAVHTVLMPNGKVLMWDAWQREKSFARVWDPASKLFASVPLDTGLFCSGHALLPDGRVAVIGGHAGAQVGIKDINIFNPYTSSWEQAPAMKYARWYPSATTLQDGRIITFSGMYDKKAWVDKPEVYDPMKNTVTELAISTPELREIDYPYVYVLPNGKLYVMGVKHTVGKYLDVARQLWTNGPSMPHVNGTAAMYRPGKLLYTGGGETDMVSEKRAATLDLTSGTPVWKSVAAMNYPRYNHHLVVLPDGNVFAVGGAEKVNKTRSTGSLTAEIYNTATNTWQDVASMRDPRMYHATAILLPDGRVLVAGGGKLSVAVDYYSAEIFSPPYLFKGGDPRPVIDNLPARTDYSEKITVDTSQAQSIGSVALIRLASNTHNYDMDQRYVPLAFTKGTNNLVVTLPSSPNIAPPGYYMLFIVDTRGVPSVAKIVHVGKSFALAAEQSGPSAQPLFEEVSGVEAPVHEASHIEEEE